MGQQTSINVQPVKGGSEQHNRREKTLDYVRPELSHLNAYWESDTQANRLASLKALAKAKTGRTMQAKATPIREGVVVIKEGTTMADLHRLADAYRTRLGVDVFQIAIHRDEGHKGSKDWKPNLHAHLVFDWTDHETGKSIKLNRQKMAEMQTITAEVLRMQRGKSSEKKHLTAQQYKAEAEAQRAEQLQEQVAELSTTKVAKEETIKSLRTVGVQFRDMVTGKTKRKEETLSGKILRLKDENAQKDAEIAKIKKEAQNSLKAVENSYENKLHNLKQDKQEAEAYAKRWKARFFTLWPSAAGAVDAIVERCTRIMRSFSDEHIASIEKALRFANTTEERQERAKYLWDIAEDEITGLCPKDWVREGKKDLDKLIQIGAKGYQQEQKEQSMKRGW